MAKHGMEGQTNNPNGRPKGSQNRATREAREAIAMFVEGNVERLQEWLDKIAKDNPMAAFDRFMAVVEYHIPKLARSELTGVNGGDIKIQHTSEGDLDIINRALGKLGGQTHDNSDTKTLQ